MNFAVDVMDKALDSLPQDLSFDAFGRLIDELELRLGISPVASSRRTAHPATERPSNAVHGHFEVDDIKYDFKAYFYYTTDELTVKVWDIQLTCE
jgi:hypothetical protein